MLSMKVRIAVLLVLIATSYPSNVSCSKLSNRGEQMEEMVGVSREQTPIRIYSQIGQRRIDTPNDSSTKNQGKGSLFINKRKMSPMNKDDYHWNIDLDKINYLPQPDARYLLSGSSSGDELLQIIKYVIQREPNKDRYRLFNVDQMMKRQFDKKRNIRALETKDEDKDYSFVIAPETVEEDIYKISIKNPNGISDGRKLLPLGNVNKWYRGQNSRDSKLQGNSGQASMSVR